MADVNIEVRRHLPGQREPEAAPTDAHLRHAYPAVAAVRGVVADLAGCVGDVGVGHAAGRRSPRGYRVVRSVPLAALPELRALVLRRAVRGLFALILGARDRRHGEHAGRRDRQRKADSPARHPQVPIQHSGENGPASTLHAPRQRVGSGRGRLNRRGRSTRLPPSEICE